MTISRRQFLVYAGMGTYAALANLRHGLSAELPSPRKTTSYKPFFTPIKASAEDKLLLPDGFRYDQLLSWGDGLGSKGLYGSESFGFNNDLIVYFPIDCLKGGKSSDEGLLWINHEYPNPLFVSNYDGTSLKTEEQIIREKLSVGGSILHVRRDKGKWTHVAGSKYTKRFTALYPTIETSGPAAQRMPHTIGTLANCSGGRTPWFTVLSCEENYPDFNRIPDKDRSSTFAYRWCDVPAQKIDEHQYGWVLEVDPFGELPPIKHTALGRVHHENTAMCLGPKKRLVVYMGDDAEDQYLYKFVSADPLDPKASRAERRKVLTQGTLYAANFETGKWLALDWERNKSKLQEGGLKDQADVLMRTRLAAKALKASPLARPEDCEVHPEDGSLYVALTCNPKHGDFMGHIVRLVEDRDNPEGESFRFEVFLAGGEQSGLACPDNLLFDKKCNLWIACDVHSKLLNTGNYKGFGNNGFHFVPTRGDGAGQAFQFASGPIECELTGPAFNENEDTLFLSVQHPGEESTDARSPTSHWPRGGTETPRPSIVAITGFEKK